MVNSYDFAFRVETFEDIRECFAEYEPYTKNFRADKTWRNNTLCYGGAPAVVYVREGILCGWSSLEACKRNHPRLQIRPAPSLQENAFADIPLEEVLQCTT